MHMLTYRGEGVRVGGNCQAELTSILICFWITTYKLYPFLVGYVEELKKDLFSLRKSELNGVQNRMAEKYQSKIPASLSSQFPDQVNKKDAVDKYCEKQDRLQNYILWVRYGHGFISQIQNNCIAFIYAVFMSSWSKL